LPEIIVVGRRAAPRLFCDMRLTTKSQYGLRVLGDLVRNWREGGNSYLQVSELAVRCNTSQKYLEQVLLPLSHAGLLESKRGQHGGYRLNRAPESISLAEALRHLEGRLMPIPQWAEDSSGEQPKLAGVLRKVREAIRDILENTSIDVLADTAGAPNDRRDEAVETLMYYI
jgi:Rrf2 family protein